MYCRAQSWTIVSETWLFCFSQLSDLFSDTKRELEETSKELEETGKKLEKTTDNLRVTTGNLCKMTQDRDEQKHLVGVHVNTETNLHSQATQVCGSFCVVQYRRIYIFSSKLAENCSARLCAVKLIYVNNNNNIQDNVYGAVIMAEPLREFTRFIWWM